MTAGPEAADPARWAPTDPEVALLSGLVAIPSVSGAEGAAATWLAEQMRARELSAALDGAGNV
ncbi:MAG TPA: acetyl-lysine deacetylase, partial [Candidatus Dormibacteraeota bacterium]|nr:acetyl-lysine deacetylase [Candidatus Dormibacteraeota bacterium]